MMVVLFDFVFELCDVICVYEGVGCVVVVCGVMILIGWCDVVVFVGLLGSGKSMLFNFVGFFDVLSSGECWFEGCWIDDVLDMFEWICCECIGFVF